MPATRLLLVRHGQTEWSAERRHTGVTDLPLDATGEAQARDLARRLPWHELQEVSGVWSSPLQRAVSTAQLAGLPVDELEPDLIEWDYGAAEGRTTAEIRTEIPGWDVWTHGVQEGESVNEVGARADRVIARARELPGTVVLVGHAHQLRITAARWMGLPAVAGRHLVLDPASWCLLAYERETPVVERWNIAT